MLREDDTFQQRFIPQNTRLKYKNIYLKNSERTIYAFTNRSA